MSESPDLSGLPPGADIVIVSACPSCGTVSDRTAYDIGSGLELCCASCDWCWGAMGQPLDPADVEIPDGWPFPNVDRR